MKVSKILFQILPILFLTALVLAFFLPLFWPVSRLFITPDTNMSDVLHFFYPTKKILSEALKQNYIPVWTDLVGTGLPLIGEGQIQAFSLINLILFKCFSLITAFNLQYVIAFFGLSTGMYLVALEFRWTKLTALFCAIIYAYSGLHIVKILHPTTLQALSYVPFIFFILLRMQKNRKTKLWLLLPFLLSQQILQGHYQYIFMSYVFYGFFFYFSWWRVRREDRRWLVKKMTIIGALTLGLSAIQIVPSFEYFLKTGGREELRNSTPGSFQLPHLLQFFYPFILGDIRIGTYSAITYGVGFHETFSYVGIIPLLLALGSLRFIKTNTFIRTCWIVILILLVFVFEKNSPLYFIFSIPPFSWFRVHSRFLAFVTFLLVLCAGYTFDSFLRIYKKYTVIFLLIFFISITDILMFATSYQPTLPITSIETAPTVLTKISDDARFTQFPFNPSTWRTYMYSYGWKHPEDYLYLLNNGTPNYSILFNKTNFLSYAGYYPLKQIQLFSSALTAADSDEKNKIATLSASAITLLRLHNTEYLISPFTVSNPEVSILDTIKPYNHTLGPFYLYHLAEVKPKYYLTSIYKSVYYFEEYMEEVSKNNVLDTYDAFIASDKVTVPSHEKGDVVVISDTSTKKEFSVDAPTDMFFVASVYLYPGWTAFLDGHKTEIVPANISGMAIHIPQGKHTLQLRFVPNSLYLGLSLSIITIAFYILVIIRSLHRTS